MSDSSHINFEPPICVHVLGPGIENRKQGNGAVNTLPATSNSGSKWQKFQPNLGIGGIGTMLKVMLYFDDHMFFSSTSLFF